MSPGRHKGALFCCSHLNPTELIQSHIGGYVASNNASFRLQEILSLLETAVLNVVAEKWPHCVQCAVRDDDLLWELDGPNDNGVQRFAVTESSFQRR